MNVTQFLVYINAILFLILLLPVFALLIFLWSHRKENGPTQVFRYILMLLAAAKIIYFSGELFAVYFILHTKLVFPISIIIPILIGTSAVIVVNYYALYKIIKIRKEQ